MAKYYIIKKELVYKSGKEIVKPISHIIHEIFIELYKNSTPRGNYDKLLKKVNLNIDYINYYIPLKAKELIISNTITKYKIIKEEDINLVHNTIYLGHSPISNKLINI